MELLEQLLMEQNPELSDTPQPQARRGAAGEVSTGLVRGATVQVPTMVGQGMKYFSTPGDPVYEAGEALRSNAEIRGENPDLILQPEAHGAITNSLAGGAEMLPASVGPQALAVLGDVLFPPGAPAFHAAAAGVTGVGFGAAQAQDSYERVLDATGDTTKARLAGMASGVIEGGFEAVSSMIGGKYITGALRLLGPRTGGRVAQQVLSLARKPRALAQFGAATALNAATEVGTEMGQNAGETAVERAAGVTDGPTIDEAAREAISPTLGMSALMVPFGGVGAYRANRKTKLMLNTLEDAQAPIEERAQAAAFFHNEIAQRDPDDADRWAAETLAAIGEGKALSVVEPTEPAVQGQPAVRQQPIAEPVAVAPSQKPAGPLSRAAGMAPSPAVVAPVVQNRDIPLPPEPESALGAEAGAETNWNEHFDRELERLIDEPVLDTGRIADEVPGVPTPAAEPLTIFQNPSVPLEQRIPLLEKFIADTKAETPKVMSRTAINGITTQTDNAADLKTTIATHEALLQELKKDAGAIDITPATPTPESALGAEAGAETNWNEHFDRELERLIDEPVLDTGRIADVNGDRPTPLDAQAHEAATSPTNNTPEPTAAQIEAGNYKKGKIKLHGLDISIENPTGSQRSGVDQDGKPWAVTMPAHYGYIRKTEGADGEHVDVYIGQQPESPKIFVVDQLDHLTGKFDEHKVIFGAANRAKAAKLYKSGFSDGKGRQRMGAITTMNADQFKGWLKDGDTTKPLGKPATPVQESVAAESPAAAVRREFEPTIDAFRAKNLAEVRQDGVSGYDLVESIMAKYPKEQDRKLTGSIGARSLPDGTRLSESQVSYLRFLEAQAGTKAVVRDSLTTAKEEDVDVWEKSPQTPTFKEKGGKPAEVGDLVRLGADNLVSIEGIYRNQPDGQDKVAYRFSYGLKDDVWEKKTGMQGLHKVPFNTFIKRTGVYISDDKVPSQQDEEAVADSGKPKAKGEPDSSPKDHLPDSGEKIKTEGASATKELKSEVPTNATPKKDGYGSANKLVSSARAEELKAKLRAKLSNLNSGVDPELISLGTELAVYHIEAGARSFVKFSRKIVADLGNAAKPYLKSWYMGAKYFPGLNTEGMDSANTLDALNVDDIVDGVVADTDTGDNIKSGEEAQKNDGYEQNKGPDVSTVGEHGISSAGEGRGSSAQYGAASTDSGYVASDKAADVAELAATEPGGKTGVRPSGKDVADQGRTGERGDAADRREGTGGSRMVDAGTGRDGRVDFHMDDPLAIFGGGQVARFTKNQSAIETLADLTDEGRAPTAEEQAVIAGYTGWGSFGQELFNGTWDNPAPKAGWEKRDSWLRDHLGKSEWQSAQRSILNAHYTDPPTVMAMWSMIERMGFTGGKVLEPAMGIGNFFAMMPLKLKERSHLTGIELDQLTGSMAQALYPKSNISIKPYQDSKTPDGFYDLIVGNWPFDSSRPADRRYRKINPVLHDYFFLKALDQVRPGGLVVGITSHGTMDKVDKTARRAMAQKGELVAAFRLPSGAFNEYAGTAVVTDIIIFRKRTEPLGIVQDAWIDSADYDTPSGEKVRLSQYYIDNPSHVIGTIDYGHGTTGARPGLIVNRPADMQGQLERIIGLVPEDGFKADPRTEHISYITNHTDDRQNSITETKDGLFVVRGEHLAPANEVLKYELKSDQDTADRTAQLSHLITLRKDYAELIKAERTTAGADTQRTALKRNYESFVKKHGPLGDSFGLKYMDRVQDPFYPALAALEINGKPAKILSESTTRSPQNIKNPTITDAFVLARNAAVSPTLKEISAISDRSEDEVRKELVASGAAFETLDRDIIPTDIYLSGNVRKKLRDAEAWVAEGNDHLRRNVEALKKVIPKDVPYHAIEVQMGATWVPDEDYARYVAHMLNLGDHGEIDAKYAAGRWKISFPSSLNDTPEAKTGFGTKYVKFRKLVNAAISNQSITVRYKDSDGVSHVADDATKEVAERISKIRETFGQWVWSDAERRVDLEKSYNEDRNAYAKPVFDGSFLSFHGMSLTLGPNPFNLRRHQVDAIWRGLVTRRSLNAHEVGTGKTFTMGGIAIESRRYGIAKKPLLLAHNANSATVSAEIQAMYPAAKILYIDNLSPESIDVKLRQIANDDWDLVVMPHSLIDRLTLTKETLTAMAQAEIDAFEQEAIEAAEDDGVKLTSAMLNDPEELKKLRSPTAKDLVRVRNRIIESIEKASQRASKETAVSFEELGIDMVLVDEAHEFKKPPIVTKMKMKGLNTGTSGKSIALLFLTQYIRANNGGGNVHLFTGTPITNTLTEVFHQMRYIMEDEMADLGIDSWDGWFGSFAAEVSDVELNAAAEYESVVRLASFINVPELRRMMGQYMDVVFSDDMPEMVPRKTAGGKTAKDELTEKERIELENGRTENAVGRPYKKIIVDNADMTPQQKREFQTLQGYARSWRSMTGKQKKETMQNGGPESPIITEGLAAKASMDVRLIDGEGFAGKEGQTDDHENSKASRAVKNILEVYRSDKRATQAVFTEIGLGNKATRTTTGVGGTKTQRTFPVFSTVDDIVARLIAGGIPKGEIAVVRGSTSKQKRKEIAQAMNDTTVRVVIGNSQTLGVGVNMQRNLRAMHHLDAPWMPGDLEQRNGRGHRQGNQWNTVLEYRYLTDRLDGRRWQVLSIKGRFIKEFLKANESTRVIEGDAAADEENDLLETFSSAAGDPRILLLEKAKKKVESLNSKERMHTQAIADAKRQIRKLENDRDNAAGEDKKLNGPGGVAEKINEAFARVKNKDFRATLNGNNFTERNKAAEGLEKLVAKKVRIGDRNVSLGNIYGFELSASFPNLAEEPYLMVKIPTGANSFHTIEAGRASIASIDGALRSELKRAERSGGRVDEIKASLKRMEEVATEPFSRESDLAAARELVDGLMADMEANPVPPPAWLRNGAPIDTEVFRNGDRFIVTGHRWTSEGWFVLAQDDKGSTVIPYDKATDEQGLRIYEARDFESPDVVERDAKASPDEDVAKFLNRGNASVGIGALTDVEFDAVFERITSGIKDPAARDGFVVCATASALPAEILAEIKKQGNKPNDMDGVFHKGKVYIVRKNITSAERLEEVLFHEWHGHAGLFAMFGNDSAELKKAMVDLYNMVTPNRLYPLGRKYGINLMKYGQALSKAGYDLDTRKAIVAEEMLAFLTRTYSRGAIARRVREIIGRIRAWLRDHGFAELAEWGETDIAFLLKRARMYAEAGAWAKNGPAVPVGSKEIMQRLRETGITEEMLSKLLAGVPRFAAGDKIVEFLPKGTVGKVVLSNDHYNLYDNYSRSGSVYIRQDGSVLIDGIWASPGDKLYAVDDPSGQGGIKYVEEISQTEKDDILKLLTLRIEDLEKMSLQINRNVAKTSPKKASKRKEADDFFSFFEDDGSTDWKKARYPTAKGKSDEKRYEKVDAISPRHDLNAIRQHVIDESLKNRTFEVGGYLHIDGEFSEAMKQAILAYRGQGGKLGKSAIEALLGEDPGVRFSVGEREGRSPAGSEADDIRFSMRDKSEAVAEFSKKLIPEKAGLPFKVLASWIPERMKAAVGSVLSNPHYQSKKSKYKAGAYDLSLERGANANDIKYEVMATQDGYEGLEGVREHWKKSTKEEKAMLDKLLVEGDILGEEYSEDDLQGVKNPFKAAVPEVVRRAYLAFRGTLAKSTHTMFDRLGRLRLLPYEDSEYHQELVDLLDEGLTSAEAAKRFGINEKAVDAYYAVRKGEQTLDEVTAPYKKESWYAALRNMVIEGSTRIEALSRNGLFVPKAAMSAYYQIIRNGPLRIKTEASFQEAPWHDLLIDLLKKGDDHQMLQRLELYNAYVGVKEYDSRLAELKEQWGQVKGYLPRIRKDGEQHVKVFKVDGDGTFTEVWMRPAKTEGGAKRLRDNVAENLHEYIPHSFDPEANYEVIVEPNQATPEEIFMGLGSHRAIEALLSKVFDKALDAGIIENQLKVQDQVLRILADEISARGFGRHRLSRSEHLIEGYETTNTPAILSQFIGGMAGWLSKSEFAMRANKLISQIPSTSPQDKVWVREYVDDALKNSTYLDQWFGTARSFVALMYLGFKASSAMLNATQNYIWGQALLSRHTKGATRKLLAAQYDVVKDHLLVKLGKPRLLTEEELWVLEEGLRRGRSHANYVRSMAGMDDTGGVMDKGQAGVRWLTEKAMMPFQAVETYWNREPALLAAYRVFRNEQGLEKAEARKQAEAFVDDTHFVIGKENIPGMLRKMGPAGRMLYTFQSYTHNYLLGMMSSLGKGEFEVVARSLTALVLFGGLAAVPFGDDLDKWYRRVFGERPLRMLDKWLRETAGEYTDFGDQLADFVMHGAPALGGVNFSRSIAVNIPWFSPEDDTLAERVTGVWGGLVQKVRLSGVAAAKGDTYRAVESLSPEALANVMRAYRMYADGATTMSGRPIFGDDGKQVRYTAKEGVIRAVGFMPLEPSKQTQNSWDARSTKTYWNDRKADVVARFRTAKDRKEALEVVREFNRELRTSTGRMLVSPVTLKSLRQALRSKPNRREMLYLRNS